MFQCDNAVVKKARSIKIWFGHVAYINCDTGHERKQKIISSLFQKKVSIQVCLLKEQYVIYIATTIQTLTSHALHPN